MIALLSMPVVAGVAYALGAVIGAGRGLKQTEAAYQLGWGHGLAVGRRPVAVPSSAPSSASTAGQADGGSTIGFGVDRAAS